MEPFAHTSGPRNAKIVFVDEAWGETEEKYKAPFAGYSGKELFRMLGEVWSMTNPSAHAIACACMKNSKYYEDSLWLRERESWLRAAGFLFTNVLNMRPANNNMDTLCAKRTEVGADYSKIMLERYGMHDPKLGMGKYLKPEYLPHLDRLRAEIEQIQPNLVVALGNTACWALLGTTSIGKIRGAIAGSTLVPGTKVLPTYHPAAVLRNWALRPIVLADLLKASREGTFSEIRRPEREILINPTLAEISEWSTRPATHYAVDIETSFRQITMIGFARSRRDAIVIPFVDFQKPGHSYWSSLDDELAAWHIVRDMLRTPIPKIFQNGMYDIQYLIEAGIYPRNCSEDTMLLHHSLYPEMNKGLGFLGSIYSNEASWKLMRHKTEELKRDE